MRIFIILIIFLILNAGDIKANVAFSNLIYRRNIKLEITGDWGPPINWGKAHMFGNMLAQFNKIYFDDTLFISVNIKRLWDRQAKYYLSYEKHTFEMLYYNDTCIGCPTSDTINTSAITLLVNDLNFDPQECLRMIYYAVHHLDEIIQLDYSLKYTSFDEGRIADSIWNEKTNSILNEKISLEQIDKLKFYGCQKILHPEGNSLDFYFQSGKYSIFKNSGELKKLRHFFKTGIFDDTGADTVMITLDKLYEITGEINSGYLFFTTFDTFFYATPHSKRISGPYKLPILRTTDLDRESMRSERSNIYLKNDSLIIPVNIYCPTYNVILDLKTDQIYVDSSTISKELGETMKREQNEEMTRQYGIRNAIKSIEVKTTKRLTILILVLIALIVNVGLIYKARKR